MARFLTDRLTSTCAVALLLSSCGGRTSDIDYELPEMGGTANGGWTSLGGAKPYGGTMQLNGGSPPTGSGGYYWATGGYYWATGGYYWATGGYYWATGGRTATGGYRATGGYPYSTGGYPYASGGKATGGKAGSGATSGYSFAGGGTAGRISWAGGAGMAPRGGTAGTAGSVFVSGGTAGRTATGGGPPTAGAAGCPTIIGCPMSCPIGYWASADGCNSCACVPPDKKLSYDTLSCPTDSLTVSVTPQQQTGTWVFNFAWTCAGTVSSLGQPLNASVGVTILNSSTDPITATNRTLMYNVASSSISIVFSNPQLVVSGSGVPQITVALTPANGAYLSIRREGNNFVGGLYLPATPVGGTASVMLAGSFTVAVPS